MKIFYDSADNNQVQAFYTGDTVSTAWAAYSSITTDDPARISEIMQYGLCSRLTIVGGEVTAVTEFTKQEVLRDMLRNRVATEYDNWVLEGVPVTGISWTANTLYVLSRDVEILTGILSISNSRLIRALIVDTDIVTLLYKFGDGNIETDITHKDLEELNAGYQTVRFTRYMAHATVKGSIDAGVMPSVSDYTECNLVEADFDGLNLSGSSSSSSSSSSV